VTNGVGEAILC